MSSAVFNYIDENRTKFIQELKDFLKIPSISADSKYKDDVKKAAEFVYNNFINIGLKAELINTKGHPIVYAEYCKYTDQPTVLIYGHYDVQPVDPLNEWLTPPFEPTEKNGNIYARGATDDKGQLFTHIKAVEAWLKTTKKLPINVKFVIEGEEEAGESHLEEFVKYNKSKLSCDFVIISDSSQYAKGIPAITYGLRGIVAFEFVLKGANSDLHSGTFGGSIPNPANNLAYIISLMHDKDRKITIPGFYEDVLPLSEWERKQYSALPFSETEYLRSIGLTHGLGEAKYSTLERKWARPTCDVNGLTSGYQGEGNKTIIPSKASAKISFRLVPNQNPQKILNAAKDFIKQHLFSGINVEFLWEHGASAVLVPIESEAIQAAKRAIKYAFSKDPVFIREGGSIPIVATFKNELHVDTLLLGWGQPDDNLHAPNEKFSLEDFYKGIIASAKILEEVAK